MQDAPLFPSRPSLAGSARTDDSQGLEVRHCTDDLFWGGVPVVGWHPAQTADQYRRPGWPGPASRGPSVIGIASPSSFARPLPLGAVGPGSADAVAERRLDWDAAAPPLDAPEV